MSSISSKIQKKFKYFQNPKKFIYFPQKSKKIELFPTKLQKKSKYPKKKKSKKIVSLFFRHTCVPLLYSIFVIYSSSIFVISSCSFVDAWRTFLFLLLPAFSKKKKNVIVSCTWSLVIWQGILIFDQGAQALINKASKWKWRIFFWIFWDIWIFFFCGFVGNNSIFLDFCGKYMNFFGFWKYLIFFGFLN